MKLEYFLDNINEFDVPKLPHGKVNSINDLYESLIENYLPKKKPLNWHVLLLKYIQQEDAIFSFADTQVHQTKIGHCLEEDF